MRPLQSTSRPSWIDSTPSRMLKTDLSRRPWGWHWSGPLSSCVSSYSDRSFAAPWNATAQPFATGPNLRPRSFRNASPRCCLSSTRLRLKQTSSSGRCVPFSTDMVWMRFGVTLQHCGPPPILRLRPRPHHRTGVVLPRQPCQPRVPLELPIQQR